jgi:hypothetical protein
MNDYLDESELFKPVKPAKLNKDGYLDESGLFPEATKAKVESRSFAGELLTAPVRGTVEAAETGLRALRMGTDTPGKEEGFIDEWAAKGIKKIEEAKENWVTKRLHNKQLPEESPCSLCETRKEEALS